MKISVTNGRLNVYFTNSELKFLNNGVIPSLNSEIYVTLRGDWYRGLFLTPCSEVTYDRRKVSIWRTSPKNLIPIGHMSFPITKVTRMPSQIFSSVLCPSQQKHGKLYFTPNKSVLANTANGIVSANTGVTLKVTPLKRPRQRLTSNNRSSPNIILMSQLVTCKAAGAKKMVLPNGIEIHF